MAKRLLVQTLFLAICLFAVVSEAMKQKKKFETFIKDDVISKFRPWAQNHNKEQFAVLMLMDEDKNWDKFKFSPEPSKTSKSNVQPGINNMHNYAAAIPGLTMITEHRIKGGGSSKKKVEKYLHSEQRIFEKYLEPLLLDYTIEKKGAPKAMVLYSWIVPCMKQSCPSKGTSGCTAHTIQELAKYAKQLKVIVAYTTLGGGMTGKTKCNAEETENQLKEAGIEVIKISYNDKEEEKAMIENLIKLGRLLETLE